MRTTPLIARVALALPVLGLAACAPVDRNARPVFAGDAAIPALAPPPLEADLPPLHGVPLTRIDRADWGPLTARAPFDGVVHPPIRPSYNRHTTNQTRAAGVAPTIDTALDLPSDRARFVVTETLTAHAIALLDVALLPVRFITDPLGDERLSPALLYKRSTPGAWRAGPAPIDDDGRTPEAAG